MKMTPLEEARKPYSYPETPLNIVDLAGVLAGMTEPHVARLPHSKVLLDDNDIITADFNGLLAASAKSLHLHSVLRLKLLE